MVILLMSGCASVQIPKEFSYQGPATLAPGNISISSQIRREGLFSKTWEETENAEVEINGEFIRLDGGLRPISLPCVLIPSSSTIHSLNTEIKRAYDKGGLIAYAPNTGGNLRGSIRIEIEHIKVRVNGEERDGKKIVATNSFVRFFMEETCVFLDGIPIPLWEKINGLWSHSILLSGPTWNERTVKIIYPAPTRFVVPTTNK